MVFSPWWSLMFPGWGSIPLPAVATTNNLDYSRPDDNEEQLMGPRQFEEVLLPLKLSDVKPSSSKDRRST
jgi:hypothetical protein